MFTKKSSNGFNTTTLERTGISNMKIAKNSHCNSSLGMNSGFYKYGTNKYGMTNTTDKSSARSRIVQKTFTNVDLSLNALTK